MPIAADKVGRLAHSKGQVEDSDITYSSWDFIRPCTGEDCSLSEHCPYWKGGSANSLSRCQVQSKYIRNQMEVFTPILNLNPDPFIIQAIGDHIIPLYHDLCKVQMEIAAWEFELMYTDKSGKRNVIPLYKEKREIQSTIWKIMRESGIITFAKELGFFMPRVNAGSLPGISGKPKKQKEGFGDGDYVDQMYAGKNEPIIEG